tara:strand:+ start:10159 stop:10662 length:504 start_codon:yes stop_codon:yes gene_type:complete
MRTLIIDNSFKPIGIVNWQKAIHYLFTERAIVIEEYPNRVRSMTVEMKIPKIMQVHFFLKNKFFKLSISNKNIFKRDNYTCAYCLSVCNKENITIDHIIPLCQGGDQKTWNNLITSCRKCNEKKGGRTPEEANMTLQFKAKRPSKLGVSFFLDLNSSEFNIFKDYIF